MLADRVLDSLCTCEVYMYMHMYMSYMGHSTWPHCRPQDVATIDAWIVVCDQGSTLEHREEILRAMPWATFIAKGPAHHRQYAAAPSLRFRPQ